MSNCTVCGNKLVPGSGACLVCLGIADESGNIDGGNGRVRDWKFGTLSSFRKRFEKNYQNVSNETKNRIDSWGGMDRNKSRTKKEKDHLRRIGRSIWENVEKDLEKKNNSKNVNSCETDSKSPAKAALSKEIKDNYTNMTPEEKEKLLAALKALQKQMERDSDSVD